MHEFASSSGRLEGWIVLLCGIDMDLQGVNILMAVVQSEDIDLLQACRTRTMLSTYLAWVPSR